MHSSCLELDMRGRCAPGRRRGACQAGGAGAGSAARRGATALRAQLSVAHHLPHLYQYAVDAVARWSQPRAYINIDGFQEKLSKLRIGKTH